MQFNKETFKKKFFLIYGMGKTGLSSYNYLKKNNKVFLYDDNKKIFKKKKIKKFFIEKKGITQKKFDYILISPGINVKTCSLKNYLKKKLKKNNN